MVSEWGITPKQSIEAECERRGRAKLIAGCVDLLEGRSADDDLLLALAGPAALTVLDGRERWPDAPYSSAISSVLRESRNTKG